MKYVLLILLAGCAARELKQTYKTVIYFHEDGTSTVYNKDDSSATIVNLNADGTLIDSTWTLTKEPLDTIIKRNQ